MPSVGMRRNTRVFGMVKGMDGARVLRSGRRLFPDFGEDKLRRANDGGDDWDNPVIKKHNGNGHGHGTCGLKCKPNGCAHVQSIKLKQEEESEEGEEMEVCEKDNEVKLKLEEEVATIKDKLYGKVYSRRRKRSDNGQEKSQALEDKMFGIRFSRRQKTSSGDNGGGRLVGFSREDDRAFGVVFEGSCVGSSSSSSGFLSLVLGYMKSARVKLPELASFLLAQPISGVFSSHGIRFSWDPPAVSTGLCKLFLVRQTSPMFSVDFSAVPFCFMHIHRSMLAGLKCLPTVSVYSSVEPDDEIMIDIESHQPCKPSEDDVEYVYESNKTMVPVVANAISRVTVHPSVRASKFSGRGMQYRNGLNSRAIQKRRSSLRKRARNPSLIGAHRANGALVSDLIFSKKNGIPFSSVVSKNKPRSSFRSSSTVSIKEANSNVDRSMCDSDPSCCFASMLVFESDRCYRVEGATVMLEMSDSREWLLLVKKDGVTKYTHKAQKIMRPPSSNRFSHAVVWTGDDNWRLEFPNRQYWLNFKDLYKDCFDRNVNLSAAKVIPVPGVCEVSDYEDNAVPFERPDIYISVPDDEVSRALAKRIASYDMDSEDEEWLKKFNIKCSTENELHEHVSEENFELIVDAFEKAYYCSPDDYSNETAAVNLCSESDLGRQEVVQAVHNYWMQKRKQKRTALLRVFQCRQVKKAPLVPKPALRKKRSLKRQASNIGRGKQPVLFKAIAAEKDALDEQIAMRRAEDAKLSAKNCMESAILKRQRAQQLMEIADLAAYKAMTALRIAEAAEVTELVDAAASHFLD
ncbi:hypothetical protein Ddye_029014 [Dipteronia dyeriana]|uniref:Enhancer of polycomb-like protein n=1 Tax=Dipteronia dyeriana TaxID=168575 RepID=A0AAD9TDS8_9ROSI|nr:hypothetical protein Ddye_029014 [Dipteronia dyeriana]